MRRLILPLLAGALLALTAGSAYAVPKDPIDPPPVDDGGAATTPPFTPPAGGFTWSLASRFGRPDSQGIVDYHWNSLEGPRKWGGPLETYDPAYVHPTSFTTSFDGCSSADEETKDAAGQPTANTYAWTFGDGGSASGATCNVGHVYHAQGAYGVSLTVTDAAGNTATYPQTIHVRDILIVSLGDSYASGEGNPDIPLVMGDTFFPSIAKPAVWEDRRCHRSAKAGPAQAALAIERSDPHTTVTFLSFACSGATLDQTIYGDTSPLDPYTVNDWNNIVGTGVLGPYKGAEPPSASDFPNNVTVPSQIDQLKAAVGDRQVDALLISGGGNDIGFGNIAQVCLLYADCKNHDVLGAYDEGPRPLESRFYQDLSKLKTSYSKLGAALASPDLHIAHTYVTQYPDSTRNDNGDYCDAMLDDILGLWFSIDKSEAQWASTTVLDGLNGAVEDAAAANGWTFVDGISDLFHTHGYCAQNNWIRRASEATEIQGPLSAKDTKGTLHPNGAGQAAYAQRILAYLKPDLAAADAQGVVTPALDSTVSGTVGGNGWLTAGAAASVTAATSAGIRGASLTVNGSTACSAPGVTCTTTPTTTNGLVTGYRWDLTFAADGVYRLDATVTGNDGGSATYTREVKVDLHDPIATQATPSAASPARGPVTVGLAGTDAAGGSGIAQVIYTLDGGAATPVGPGGTVVVSGEGAHTLAFWSVDNAGRSGGSGSLQVTIDSTPPAVRCAADDGTWHADNVTLACTASDAGSGLAAAADASFTLSTDVAEGAETADAATGTQQVCDVAGNCTTAGPVSGIRVDRKAPTLTVSPTTVDAVAPDGAPVTYTATAIDGTDPSPTLTCAPPSGSTFAIGTHTVACTARDHAGNTVSASFTVTVRGAADQLVSLIDELGTMLRLPAAAAPLQGQLRTAAVSLAEARPKAACAALGGFSTAVQHALPLFLTSAEKARLIADAARIRNVLGC